MITIAIKYKWWILGILLGIGIILILKFYGTRDRIMMDLLNKDKDIETLKEEGKTYEDNIKNTEKKIKEIEEERKAIDEKIIKSEEDKKKGEELLKELEKINKELAEKMRK